MCKCGMWCAYFFLLYANLLVLVTLCEGNHYPFIEERYFFFFTYPRLGRFFYFLGWLFGGLGNQR